MKTMVGTPLSIHFCFLKSTFRVCIRVYPLEAIFHETNANYIWGERARSTDDKYRKIFEKFWKFRKFLGVGNFQNFENSYFCFVKPNAGNFYTCTNWKIFLSLFKMWRKKLKISKILKNFGGSKNCFFQEKIFFVLILLK